MSDDKAIRAALLTAKGMDKKLLHQDGPLSIYKQYGNTYIAEHNGQKVGEMNLSSRAPYATSVEVHPNFRRMGIASKLYDVAESDIGRKMMPSPLGLSDDATKMWKKRLNNYDDMGQMADIVREAVNVGRAAGVGKSAANRMMPFGYDPETEKVKGYSMGGAMELARAVVAKNRAGGQIAPSKYLPDVPRQAHAYGGRAKERDDIWWHGSPSGDLRGGTSGLHLGTREAALDALRARIGVPADGSMWDGTKEYGKTLLAGKKTLNKMGKHLITGHNARAPEEDYYPHEHPEGMPTVGDRVPVDPSWKPFLRPFRIVGPMTNTPRSPHGDSRANAMMKASLTKGNAKNGYYYTNDGEDSGSISAVVPNGSHVEPVDQDNKYASGGYVPAATLPVPRRLAVAAPLRTSAQPTIMDTLSGLAGLAETATGAFGKGEEVPTAETSGGKPSGAAALSLAASKVGMNENDQREAIKDYLTTGGANLDPATTAWCAAFVNSTLQQTGVEGTGSNMARSFLDWGQPVEQPQAGDVAVFSRGDPNGPYGHVGFFQGYDENGNILVLGGNQGDAVSVSPYSPDALLGFRRYGYADGGEVADLGQAREQKQLQGFHKGMMGDIHTRMSNAMDAHQKAVDAGVFDGYEVGDVLKGSAHPMRITGRYMQKWKPTPMAMRSFERMGAQPTIVEHEGEQYIPMLRYETGVEGQDGWQRGDAYLDGVKAAGYQKMGGLRAVKADGGAIHLIHGGSDFEEIDPRFSGTGEPGGIRPLGKGLYTYVIDPEDPDRAKDAIGWAKRYATKYGRGKKTLHVFRVPKSASTVFNGPRNIAGLGAEPQDKLEAYRAHRAAEPAKDDPAWWDWSRKGNALYEDVKNAADLRMEHLPIGLTEAAINNPKIAQRVGKFDPDADPEEIIKAIRGYADGGMVDDQDEDITAYHGSPHDFDEFDIGKLGTGEGAQSYGHGLYFAGNEGVAKSYRNALSDTLIHPEGTPDLEKRAGQMALTFSDNTPEGALQWLSKFKNGATHTSPAMTPELVEAVSKRFSSGEFRPGGHMYKVRLRVKPHELLDWDKPLSQQHPNVQAAIKDIGVDTSAREWKNGADLGSGNRLIVTPHPDLPDDEQFTKYEMQTPLGVRINLDRRDVERLLGKGDDLTGAQIHQRLVDMGNRDGAIGEHLRADNPMKSGPKWAAEALMRHGIKGIRYRDAMSRNKEDGDATHNYVMFHHDPVKVVDKYEYGGAVEKSGGGSMGDDDSSPTDLGAARALRNFNQNSTGPTAAAEGVFNRLAAARDAAASAHEEAIKDGVFKSAQIGDVFKYKPLDTYTPMKVVDHGMVHVSRWGGINPPKYVYQDHFPVAEVQYQDASKERRKVPIELLEDRSRYDFISGKPRIARADGGRLDLYSKAARIIRGMKDRKMDVADILEYAKGKGAKRTEIAHADVPPGKATPSQVAEHIEFMQPQIGVHKREGGNFQFDNPQSYLDEMGRLHDAGRHEDAERLYSEFERFEGYGGKDAPLYTKYQLPGGRNYREHVLTLDSHPDDQTYTAPIHWGKLKNPLAHIRMSDRMIGNKKILHIEEMQSDWNNDARKVGFRTGREKQDYEDYVAQMRQKAIDKVKARTGQDYYDPMTGETAPTMSPMVAQAQIEKYQRMDPYMLALKMGMHDEHRRMADAAKGGSGVPRAPYINPEKDDVYEMAMKHVLMEAAKGGYDGIAFTPDEEQELRWPGHTFKGIYNKRLPGIAQRLVQPHDLDTDTDDMIHLQGWAVPMIPLSDKARDSITQNGFSSFRRGGMVDAALAATRRFTKDGQHVTMRLKD